MNRKEHKRKSPEVWRLLLGQLVLTALVLLVFALFHHVIPDWKARQLGAVEPVGRVEPSSPPQTAEPVASTPASASLAPQESLPPEGQSAIETGAPEGTEEPQETEAPAELPDTWQTRFAEHFSGEIILSEYSYVSPTLSVTVTEYAHPEKYPRLTYYVADCYITDISSFRVGFPSGSTYDSGERIAAVNEAVLAINGDSMLVQHTGLLIRNGDIYSQTPTGGDLCLMFSDGSMEVCGPNTYTVEEILAKAPLHAWQFGPSLLDENGQPLESFNISRELLDYHPRTAMGYYEPGHYCFVVVEGRNPSRSDGAQMATLAQIMSDLGCRLAYNLDGGASSMMVLNGKTLNYTAKTGVNQGDRYINDMVILVEPRGEEEP